MLLNNLLYSFHSGELVIVLFICILLFNLIGAKVSNYIKKHNPDAKTVGTGPLENALLGLLALLLSFTFGLSSSRFDARRSLIVQESNNIGTVILRCDLYPDSIRTELRNDLQKYVEARITYYNTTDEKEINKSCSNAEKIFSFFKHASFSFLISTALSAL